MTHSELAMLHFLAAPPREVKAPTFHGGFDLALGESQDCSFMYLSDGCIRQRRQYPPVNLTLKQYDRVMDAIAERKDWIPTPPAPRYYTQEWIEWPTESLYTCTAASMS